MMRRFTVPTLVAGVVLSTAVAVPAAGQQTGFGDVPDDNVHRSAIERGVDLDLIRGTTATTFAPAASLTRGQTASLLLRTLEAADVDVPALAGSPTFTDTGAPHEEAIRRLAAAGVVEGRAEGRFAPQVAVTRDQLASLIVRTVEFATDEDVEPQGDNPFADVSGGVHADNIVASNELGLLLGKEDGRFDPRGDTRRDQAASVLLRTFDLLTEGPVETGAGELWVLDQGTDLIHVYDGDAVEADPDTEAFATIDVRPGTLAGEGFAAAPTGENTVPHMIEFDSQERYAFIASTAGGVTLVVDARTKEVVEVLPTGGGSHMAAVTPDDAAVWVAVIGNGANPRVDDGTQRMTEIVLDDLDGDATFTIDRELEMSELLEPLEDANGWTYPSYSPICHQYSADGDEAWITLGPGWNQGGLVALDLETGTLVEDAAYDPAEVKANCGVSVTDERVIVNWSGQVVEGDDTLGEWYVIDPTTYELEETRAANGFDTHGLRLSPDGSTYWQVNRNSDDAMLIDAATLETVATIEDVADTPDILEFSPDGRFVYITQRGPSPRSGAVHAATGDQPGLRIVDTETLETVTVLEQDEVRDTEGAIVNDVHGVGVRTASPQDVAPDAPAASAPASTDGEVTATTVAFATAAEEEPPLDAVRAVPSNLGFHCELPG
jgi:DNA-binding beta-propeller fold protein YncE